MTRPSYELTAWYERNYPQAPRHDPRCMATLAALGQLYNLRRFGERHRLDGGVRRCGNGIEVHLKWAVMATFDGGELTALVLAAHRHCCRVELSVTGQHMVVRVHPRDPSGTRFYERHPSLADLAGQAQR